MNSRIAKPQIEYRAHFKNLIVSIYLKKRNSKGDCDMLPNNLSKRKKSCALPSSDQCIISVSDHPSIPSFNIPSFISHDFVSIARHFALLNALPPHSPSNQKCTSSRPSSHIKNPIHSLAIHARYPFRLTSTYHIPESRRTRINYTLNICAGNGGGKSRLQG